MNFSLKTAFNDCVPLFYLSMKSTLYTLLVLLFCPPALAQMHSDIPRHNTYNIKEEIDRRPYFSLYKDNYVITGSALGQKPTGINSDVKFQISVSQRITKTKLPLNTYLFVAYTQKAFWNVYQKSLPMHDLNFNPGIGFMSYIIHRNQLTGRVSLLFEHESNGRDSIWSRSWNKITLFGAYSVNRNIELQLKAWIPIIDSKNNKDILDYCGIAQLTGSYMTDNRRFGATLILTKRSGWNFNFNTTVELSYRLFANENQYLFLQYYNGYGEGLLDYNRFHSRLRLGFVIKSRYLSNY